jgi:acetylornithine/N-succinyldiaminopimelate aminotransferase
MTDRSVLMHTYADPQVVFVRGSGAELWDAEDRRYLDFLCGIAVTSLGHAHPEVAAAVSEQVQVLLHTSNLFGTLPALQVAETLDRLIREVGDGDDGEAGNSLENVGGRVFFCNSGSEANECAIKLVRRYWAEKGFGRHVIVSALDSFHGRTLASLTATGQPHKHEGIGPIAPGFVHVPYDDLAALRDACSSDDVAAVLLEPIQGEAGVIVPSDGYVSGASEICEKAGVLLIIDEVQTGMGRTGRWFGFQASGIRPDVVTMAKALGNGVPIGACWAKAEVADAYGPGDHGTTFGGQPLATSAAAAVLKVMQEMDAPARTSRLGEILEESLESLEGVKSVRGAGLLIGVELEVPDAPGVVAEALRRGLVVNAPRPDTIRIAPPFVITEQQLDEGVRILGEAIAERRAFAATGSDDGAPARTSEEPAVKEREPVG